MAINNPRYDDQDQIPNQTLGSQPHTPIFTRYKPSPLFDLDARQGKGGGKKGKGGKRSNLMDTGPDDGPFGEGTPTENAFGKTDAQALSRGVQTQGGLTPGAQAFVEGPSQQGAYVSSGQGRSAFGGQQEGVGFRDAAQTSFATPPPTSPEAPPAPGQAPQRQRRIRQSNLMDSGPDDGAPAAPAVHRDAQGNIYRVGSASDPYAASRAGGGIPSLSGLVPEGAPFPGVTGAILGGVSGLSNRNLDKIEAGAEAGTEGYTYGEVGGQRFGTSPGFIPGTTVTSGPTELRGLAVNETVPNTAENQQKLLEAQKKDEYQSVTGNTYVGDVATAKRESDREAQSQGYGSAVTDSSGKAVRVGSGQDKGRVVTSGPKITAETHGDDDSGNDSGGGGK